MNYLDVIRVNLGRFKIIKAILNPINQQIRKLSAYRMNDAYRKHGKDVFDIFVSTINDLAIPYWPEFGTLLGIYREGDFIKHDFDFDFGAFINHSTLIEEALIAKGFKLKHSYYCPNNSEIKEDTFSYKGVNIDVFYFVHKKDGDYCFTFIPSFTDKLSKMHYRIKFFKFNKINLSKIKFRGLDMMIPKDTQDHLIVSYGPNFMIPDPNFKSITYNYIENCYALEK